MKIYDLNIVTMAKINAEDSLKRAYLSFQASSGQLFCGHGCLVCQWGQNWKRAERHGYGWEVMMAGCLGWMSEVTGWLGLSDLPTQNRASKFFIIEYAFYVMIMQESTMLFSN